MTQELVVVGFAYEALDSEVRNDVQECTQEIKGLMRRTREDLVKIGEKLIEVKGKVEHGQFGAWLGAEFDWTERTARRFMSVAREFDSDTVSVLNADAKALYLLAAPSTPEAAREEAVRQAEAGESITYGKAQEIVGQVEVAERQWRDPPPAGQATDGSVGTTEHRGAPPRPEVEQAEPKPPPATKPTPQKPAAPKPAVPPPPPKPAPEMRPIEPPEPANAVLMVTIFAGGDLAERRVMATIGEQGGNVSQMRGGTYGELLEVVADLCERQFADNGASEAQILMEV